MVESAARRDRIDSQAVTGWYLWEAPKKPACVYLSFDLIDKLEREVVENFRSLTSRGSEVGGILLGGVAPGMPAGISIEDYEAIPCDYSRGPLYRLSDTDLGRFERAMEQRSNGNLQVVGFFRSHTRKGLTLDAEDLAFLEAKFRNPYSLALLVRPFATKASVAGIFLREEAGFNSEASALEFPFRSSQLTPSKRTPEPATPPPAPTRAQVVPIATRREVSAPPAATTATVPPPPPAVETPKSTPVPEARTVTPPATAAPVAEPEKPKATQQAAPPPAPKTPPPTKNAATAAKTAPPPAKPAPAAAAPAAPAPTPAKPKETAPAPKVEAPKPESKKVQAPETTETKRASRVPLLTGLLAAGLLVFVALFVYPGFLHRSSKPTASVMQDTSPLTLRVEHTGTDLLLTWNRDSAAIRNASHAALAINDGERHENYDMDLAQLRTGSIVYSPLGGDVSFQMEVVEKDQSRTATETLRLLQTRPSPMPAAGQDTKAAKNNTPTPANGQTPTAPTAAENKPPEPAQPEETKQAPAPVRQFDASSLSGRLRPARSADLADVPSPASASPVAPKVYADGSLPFASLPGALAAPPAPAPPSARTATPAPAAPAASQSASKLDPSGGQIQPAQLISRKEPEYPLLARQMGAKGTVELIATIGSDGAVKAVKVVKGHPLLIKAAQDAVMQWRYRPTLLNGVPVQNDTRITLNFVAQQ